MTYQYYETQEVIRQCAAPGTMVRYNGRVYKATTNTRGKLTLTNTHENITIRDRLVFILLDWNGEPLKI